MANRGGARPGSGRKPQEHKHRQILRMHASRIPVKSIVREVGCSRRTVHRVIQKKSS